jgi:hypothetical protein
VPGSEHRILVLETRASGGAVQRAVGGVRSSTPAVVGERGRHGEDLCGGVVLPRMLEDTHGGRSHDALAWTGTAAPIVGRTRCNPPDVLRTKAPLAAGKTSATPGNPSLSAAGHHHLNGLPAFVCPPHQQESASCSASPGAIPLDAEEGCGKLCAILARPTGPGRIAAGAG